VRPGTTRQGLDGVVDGVGARIAAWRYADAVGAAAPPAGSALECFVFVDGALAATCRFHDTARTDSRSFISHLGPRHNLARVLLVSGDRESEVRYLADLVGAVFAGRSPEEKVAITRAEAGRAPTLFIEDGINDAPRWPPPPSAWPSAIAARSLPRQPAR
jgi:cation transport ATPase